ncbi:C40 family peptidase [Planococcus lenghuensis]|uniref:Hydrolase n=1 Tax=Planococcus lenghuensis TaxID=2213202 RepID=A0A1Q2L1B8_9BACL|nr:C40 family peptidase [Planococcus lenghuensis]AQQ54250.1 hydrolase [Planococcus lenghuensis]
MKKLIMLMLVLSLLIPVNVFTATKANAATATPDEVADYALKFLGVPYKYGGDGPYSFDCSGFTSYVFAHFGISLPRSSSSQYGVGTYVSKSNLQKGDLVFFQNTYKSGLSHVGIYIGNGDVISAESEGIAISDINTNPYWKPRYLGARRVNGVEEPKVTSLAAGEYHDVASGHWAQAAIKDLTLRGIVTGTGDGYFSPNNQVTRAQAATMIARTLGLSKISGSKFPDVSSSHWASGYINAVAEAGIVYGRGDGTFDPEDPITRAEITVILNRAFDLQMTGSSVAFSDISGHWAESDILIVASNGLAKGDGSGVFNPESNATRAEFSLFVYRALGNK